MYLLSRLTTFGRKKAIFMLISSKGSRKNTKSSRIPSHRVPQPCIGVNSNAIVSFTYKTHFNMIWLCKITEITKLNTSSKLTIQQQTFLSIP